MPPDLKIIPTELLESYCSMVSDAAHEDFEALHESELSIDTFSFHTSVSAVFSSRIEGEDIELDSFIKHKRWGAHFSPDHTRKTDDLYDAYQFAQNTELSAASLNQAHALLTQHILQTAQRGKYRTGNMFVVTTGGRIEYVAATPAQVKPAMKKLHADVASLLASELKFREVLFYASIMHLIFVKIHPYEDGNGRAARLLEKWFISQKLGPKSWFIPSERNYYTQHQTYYSNIRSLGLEYDSLDFSNALPFLLMLPQSIRLQS
jgi:Fic family protein